MTARRIGTMALALLILATLPAAAGPSVAAGDSATLNDPFLWLEEVDGDKALDWVREISAATTKEIEAVPEFRPIRDKNLEIYNSNDRIPYPSRRGAHVYNFWQDDIHVRGIWRRTTVAAYLSDSPTWETVIDLDALVAKDEINWVWKGASCLQPDHRRCMISLSRGGGDSTVKREFDTTTKKFVEGGFELPDAKSVTSWKDADTLWVGTDLGEGSLTTSGYPRVLKMWKRGTDLAESITVFEGRESDVSAGGYTLYTPEGSYHVLVRTPEFFRQESFLLLGDRFVKLDIPEDASWQAMLRDQMILSLRSDWTVNDATYLAGALISIDLDRFLRGGRTFDVLFEPSERTSLQSVTRTKNQILISTLDNVRGRIHRATIHDGKWAKEEVPMPGIGTVSVADTSLDDDVWFLSYTDFLTPSSLYVVDEQRPKKTKSLPDFFDSRGMKVAQYDATSADGTKVPYFVVMPKGFKPRGSHPTLLYGYGGFEVSMRPRYSATTGSAWLERGGVYVLANIRGGGEFGPGWHKAALKENRHKCFEDFIAVAEDLVSRKISSADHLGIMGGSNGGLLVGAALTIRPELFKAVVSSVPLLDMRRYHKLLAGASWMSEYGDPDDPEDWAYIKRWSPYHNIQEDAEYPKTLFVTSTRDDRVHPAHARKMVARLKEMGHPVYYYENTEGGHSSGAINEQRAYTWAINYAYLWKMLR